MICLFIQLSVENWRTPDDDDYVDVGTLPDGLNHVLTYFEKKIPSEKIILNATATQLDYSSGHSVQVTFRGLNAHENSETYDHVIVTCSLGYLKKHHNELFTPRLAEKKRKAIELLGTCVIA